VLVSGIGIIGAKSAFEPLYSLADPRVGMAGFGAFVGHAILCGSDARRRRALRAGIILEVIRMAFVLETGVPVAGALLSIGYGLFAAALIDFMLHQEWRFLGLAVLVPIGMANAHLGLSAIVHGLTPLTLDGALYGIDLTLHVPVSRWTGELFAKVPLVTFASLVAYALLPGAIAAGICYEEYNTRRNVHRGVGVNLLLAYAISGSLAAILYWLCPGTGPAHAFGSAFPDHLPPLKSVTLNFAPYAPLAPRNAMPSLHVAWTIILARSTSGGRASVKWVVIALAGFTILATMGSGEHYVVDLIAAVPFFVALEAATAHRYVTLRRRILPLVIGTLLYAACVLTVRNASVAVPFLMNHAVLTWTFALLTVALPLLVALRSKGYGAKPTFALCTPTGAWLENPPLSKTHDRGGNDGLVGISSLEFAVPNRVI
jgi:hypothetical protein